MEGRADRPYFIGPFQNGPVAQMRIFSENLRLVSFIHGYLHAKNQSRILIY